MRNTRQVEQKTIHGFTYVANLTFARMRVIQNCIKPGIKPLNQLRDPAEDRTCFYWIRLASPSAKQRKNQNVEQKVQNLPYVKKQCARLSFIQRSALS